MIKILCELVGIHSTLPTKAHETDAGFDLYATSDITIQPGEIVKHPLNIRLQLPYGTWAEIASKSGLGSKGLLVFAGVIDEGYRGIPHVIMTNLNHKDGVPIEIKQYQKIAQLIMSPFHHNYEMEQAFSISSNTSRGSGGFGSTGAW